MAFRNIVIENTAHISLKNRQLIIRTDSEHSIPVEDISALLLENKYSTITTAALSCLGQCGCAVFICDDKHMPCAVLEPFSQHSRQLKTVKNQIAATEPFKKRVWQSLIISKIRNQAKCLELNNIKAASDILYNMSLNVKSGDAENVEAVAAQKYFPALFGTGFTREYDNGCNSALNYGYAILRGSIARSLAVYGFIPSLGVHHRSELNSFNLADDLIEPFRPLVDLLVSSCFEEDDELTPEKKRLLFNCLNLDILSGGQHHSVAYAIERLVRSLSTSFENGRVDLCLPELIDLKQHRYE